MPAVSRPPSARVPHCQRLCSGYHTRPELILTLELQPSQLATSGPAALQALEALQHRIAAQHLQGTQVLLSGLLLLIVQIILASVLVSCFPPCTLQLSC